MAKRSAWHQLRQFTSWNLWAVAMLVWSGKFNEKVIFSKTQKLNLLQRNEVVKMWYTQNITLYVCSWIYGVLKHKHTWECLYNWKKRGSTWDIIIRTCAINLTCEANIIRMSMKINTFTQPHHRVRHSHSACTAGGALICLRSKINLTWCFWKS